MPKYFITKIRESGPIVGILAHLLKLMFLNIYISCHELVFCHYIMAEKF